jgi:hypothetical protein
MEVVWEMGWVWAIMMEDIYRVLSTQQTIKLKEGTRINKRQNLLQDVWSGLKICQAIRTIDFLIIFKNVISLFFHLLFFILCVLECLESTVGMFLIFLILSLFDCESTHSFLKLFIKFYKCLFFYSLLWTNIGLWYMIFID